MEENISDFYKSVAEGIIVLDCKGMIIYANYAANTIFHLPDTDLKKTRIMNLIGDDLYNEDIKDAITDALFSETHKVIRKVNYRNLNRNYVLMLSSIYLASEDFKGIIITFSDITELEKVEITEKRLQLKVTKNAELTRQNEILTAVFNKHLDNDVVEQLLDSAKGIGISAMETEMSLFMLMSPDLQKLVASMPPNDYLEMLNHYYDCVIPVIKKNNGTIFELHSDSILVGFGAPKKTEDYTDLALLTACQIQDLIAEINAWNQKKSYPDISVKIGIHTDEFTVGIIGGTSIMKYDVFGKNINFTARMAVSASPSDIVLSQSALDNLKGQYKVLEQYEFVPKGISEPVKVYKMGQV